MATFGQTEYADGFTYGWLPSGNNTVGACIFEMPEDGDLTHIAIRFGADIPSDPDDKFRLALYSTVAFGDDLRPYQLIAESSEGTSVANAWNELAVASEGLTSGTFYALCWQLKSSHGGYYKAGGTKQAWQSGAHTYGVFPADWVTSGQSNFDREYSIYATYTPGAPPAGQPYISRVQRVTGMRSWGGISSISNRFPDFKPRTVI